MEVTPQARGARKSLPRPKMYRQTMIAQALLTAPSIWVARDNQINLFAPWTPTVQALAYGALALALIVGMQMVPPLATEVSEVAPRTGGEHAMFIGMVVLAAFGEEVMYRGAPYPSSSSSRS